VAGVIVLVVLLVSLRHDDSILGSVAAGLVIGGAAGNIIDRLFRGEGWLRGAVVDFIDLQWFPIFNLADAALTIGAVLILVSALLGNDRRAGTAA
jgi:signal peptidase II